MLKWIFAIAVPPDYFALRDLIAFAIYLAALGSGTP